MINWIIATILPILGPIIANIGDQIFDLLAVAGDVIKGITDILGGFIDFCTGAFTGDFDKCWQGIEEIIEGFKTIAESIFKYVKEHIFQPFIENAMYHGLEPKIGKGKISLRGWQEQNNMIFTIEDDGVGIDDMSRLENGYGVRNVIERIKLNYGEKYGVTFESSPGNGTKVTIVVPVR